MEGWGRIEKKQQDYMCSGLGLVQNIQMFSQYIPDPSFRQSSKAEWREVVIPWKCKLKSLVGSWSKTGKGCIIVNGQ